MRPGESIFFGHNFDVTDGQRYQQKAQRNIGSGMPPEGACKKAFGDLMDELSNEGRKVGGHVFSETLERKQTAFRKALM